MSADLEPYLAARRDQRAARRESVLGVCTRRERDLIKEAAVMGYVRGTMAGPLTPDDFPSDSFIRDLVVDCCLTIPELYPAFRRLDRRAVRNG